jgi:hypothetical protein
LRARRAKAGTIVPAFVIVQAFVENAGNLIAYSHQRVLASLHVRLYIWKRSWSKNYGADAFFLSLRALSWR